MPYRPPFYGIFWGHIFLQLWGVGVVRIIFKDTPHRRRGQGPGRFAFHGARSPRIYSISRFGEKFPALSQGRILAVWIFAAKLPNSDLNFAVDFLVDFIHLFSPRKKARKNPPKHPPQNSPGTLFGKIPLGFLQKPFLDTFRSFPEEPSERIPQTATAFSSFLISRMSIF